MRFSMPPHRSLNKESILSCITNVSASDKKKILRKFFYEQVIYLIFHWQMAIQISKSSLGLWNISGYLTWKDSLLSPVIPSIPVKQTSKYYCCTWEINVLQNQIFPSVLLWVPHHNNLNKIHFHFVRHLEGMLQLKDTGCSC